MSPHVVKMVNRWVHINFIVEDKWVLPIWSAIDEAAKAGTAPPRNDELNDLGLSISTRLDFLPRIIERVNTASAGVYEKVSQREPEHEFEPGVEGIAFDLADNALKYELLIDIDSLLFELNSIRELVTRLFEQLHTHAGQEMPQTDSARNSIESIVKDAGENASWFKNLADHRNLFIHEAAPYVAVDISSAPQDYDLLIMKKNIKEFSDHTKFIQLSEINEIVHPS